MKIKKILIDFLSSRDPREGRDGLGRPRSPISARSPIRASTPNDEMAAKRLKTDDIRKSGHVSFKTFYCFSINVFYHIYYYFSTN